MRYIPDTLNFPSAEPVQEIIKSKNHTTMIIKLEPEDSERKSVGDSPEELPVFQFEKLKLDDEDAESEDEKISNEEKESNIKHEIDDDEEIDPSKLVGKGPVVERKINTSRAQNVPYNRPSQPARTTIINGLQMNGGSHVESDDYMFNYNLIPVTVAEIAETQIPPSPNIDDFFPELNSSLDFPELDFDDITNDDIERLINITGISLTDPNISDYIEPNVPMENYSPVSENVEEDRQDSPYSPDSAYDSTFGNSPHSATEFSPRNENHFDHISTSAVYQQLYDGSPWSSEHSLPTPPMKLNIPSPDVTSIVDIQAQGSRKPQKENLPTLVPSCPSNIKPSNNIIKRESLRDRLISKMRPDRKVAVWYSTIKESDQKFNEKNEKGQTPLMKDLLLDPRVPGIVESVYERIGRIKTSRSADLLCHRDIFGHCALYQAATLHSDLPEIAAYIAESYASLGCDVNKPYKEGDTILHYLAQLGDKFDRVLDELLKVTVNGERIFRIDQQNNAGNTPLHVAALHHMTSYAGSTFSIASTLIKHRSSVWIKNSDGATPLHVAAKSKACDPEYFRKLLEQRGAENIQDKDGNTPIHLVALAVSVPNVAKLKKVIQHLLTSKARLDIINKKGKRPLDYIHPLCKEEISK